MQTEIKPMNQNLGSGVQIRIIGVRRTTTYVHRLPYGKVSFIQVREDLNRKK